ncbi:MAG: 3-isopropylmalate dehydratase small subunit [Pyrinomonadaceae bacterium]|nr:3-isopropylmalate dehydratase small subunit [Pyrinomonadaceae bacterium]
MQAFTEHRGRAVVIDRPNIDTDQIIPKQFLKRIERTGYGEFLFYDWRINADGSVNPDFVLNDRRVDGASILIAGENFGCGSSREHAPWSLLDFGFRVVIAPSFADIFYGNSLKNGLLPVVFGHSEIDQMKMIAHDDPEATFAVSLLDKTITLPDGTALEFEIGDFSRYCLINGLDEIGLTMEHEAAIATYERSLAYYGVRAI